MNACSYWNDPDSMSLSGTATVRSAWAGNWVLYAIIVDGGSMYEMQYG